MGAWCSWIPLLLIFFVLFLRRKKQKMIIANFIQRKKEKKIMQELVQRFVGKDCFINLLEGTVDGVLREVTNGGLVMEKNGKQQIVNIEYVIKICEYPHNKKGKRSMISLE